MAWVHDFPGVAMSEAGTEKALRGPLGAMSPLWAVFGAAATLGVAYWMATQWTRAVNIEGLVAAVSPKAKSPPKLTLVEPTPAPEPAAEVVPPPVVLVAEALEAAAAPVAEVVEAVVEAPAPTIETAPVEEPPPPPATPDDLTRMTGIGPKLSLALAERGVTRFTQIAAWTAEDLAEVDAALSLKGRAVREAWVAQAKRFAKAK
jgi:predicted flap endonuclease-1-like 5' DNA nuclease